MSVLKTNLAGWGRCPVVETAIVRPERTGTLRQIVGSAESAPLLARGAGRSYGDAALNRRGSTVLMERLNRMLDFDDASGVLRCEAGVTLAEIGEVFVPRGWFLPVTPGTKYVTVGGAVAFDIHGKNHHCDGPFSNFVRSFELLVASGETLRCAREQNADLFWATIAGAGLTGVITEVAFALRPIETSYIDLRTFKARDLDDVLALFDAHEKDYSYSVAWIDCLAMGKTLGRSMLMLGNHAGRANLDARRAKDPLHYAPRQLLSVPFDLPNLSLNALTVKAFNTCYYQRQRTRERRSLSALDPFFYPLDSVGAWNRMYGSRGFAQYQCVFPPEVSRQGLLEMLTRLSESGRASFLAVLKRLGPAARAPLSFPMPGYTLSVDLPVTSGLPGFLQRLDDFVLGLRGRVYLAKDAFLTPRAFRAMYPLFPEWLAVKRRIDPSNLFASDLSERLEIFAPA